MVSRPPQIGVSAAGLGVSPSGLARGSRDAPELFASQSLQPIRLSGFASDCEQHDQFISTRSTAEHW
ncbi:hypothetical protein COCON_G00221910 [Conger conger]|uniref:Uncharacterized protein n=1 Tax=Conger conger TaxID=82655 RepID=A0A9Q1CW69_CONCO|nr:hypothetical protein COCON_G00221910 [Conger conger]